MKNYRNFIESVIEGELKSPLSGRLHSVMIEKAVDPIITSDQKLARQVKLYFSHRYSGLKLKKLGRRYGISESGVTQASRRVRLKIEDDKKFARMITKIAKYVNV